MSQEERLAFVALGHKARWAKPSAHKRQSKENSERMKQVSQRYRAMKAQLESQDELGSDKR
jgi:hypothetical protein